MNLIKNLKFQIYNFIVFLLFLYFAEQTIAVTLVYSNIPSTITSDPFNINVTIDGANPGTNYLRIDLFKEGTTNYFGETQIGSNWYQGSEGKQYHPITIGSDKIATASVTGRVGQPSLSDYPSPGDYYLRIRRYTEKGNPASSDDQAPIKVNITLPVASPTPSPEPSPKPTPSPSPSHVSIVSVRPSPRTRILSTPRSILSTVSAIVSSPEVLGDAKKINNFFSPTNTPVEATNSGSIAFPAGVLLVAGGGILSGAAGFLAYKNIKQKD